MHWIITLLCRKCIHIQNFSLVDWFKGGQEYFNSEHNRNVNRWDSRKCNSHCWIWRQRCVTKFWSEYHKCKKTRNKQCCLCLIYLNYYFNRLMRRFSMNQTRMIIFSTMQKKRILQNISTTLKMPIALLYLFQWITIIL